MHPALHSWREELPAAFVRLLAYLGGIAVLSIAAAQLFQSRRRSARQAEPIAGMDRDRAAVPGLRAVDPGSRRRAASYAIPVTPRAAAARTF